MNFLRLFFSNFILFANLSFLRLIVDCLPRLRTIVFVTYFAANINFTVGLSGKIIEPIIAMKIGAILFEAGSIWLQMVVERAQSFTSLATLVFLQ